MRSWAVRIVSALVLLAGLTCSGLGFAAHRSGLAELLYAIVTEPEGADIADEASFERWLLARPDGFGLVVLTVGEPEGALTWNAGVPRPLASTQKIVVLLAYALAVHDGRLDPATSVPRAEWEARYVPGTDGEAHPTALARLGLAETDDPTLDQLASAMIRESDNAATDVLLARVPAEHLDGARAILGDGGVDPIHPMLADLLLLADGGACDLDADARARRSSVLTEEFLRDPVAPDLPGIRAQRELYACAGARGTPEGFATAMGRIASGDLPVEVAELARAHLEWPMADGRNAERFARFGAKGGTVPGVLTEAAYVVPREGPYAGRARVAVLFMDRMGTGAWVTLISSYVHQRWLIGLAEDPAKVDAVRAALGSPR